MQLVIFLERCDVGTDGQTGLVLEAALPSLARAA